MQGWRLSLWMFFNLFSHFLFLKGLRRVICYVFKKRKLFPKQFEKKNNGTALLLKTIFKHQNCSKSSFAMDGKNGRRLKLENVGPTFLSFNAILAKITQNVIMVSASW